MPPPNPLSIFAPGLNQPGLEWMVVGSIASNAYGEFRVTNDIDLVAALDAGTVVSFAAAFPESEFYCPPVDVIAIEASRSERGHFNLIHHETGFKADIYLAGSDSSYRWALARRRKLEIDHFTVWIAPPEYVILGKLEFYREGGSEKHVHDIRGILAVTEVDLVLLESEIAKRNLMDAWRRCRIAG